MSDDNALTDDSSKNQEQSLRAALAESLKEQVAQICKEMVCEPPSITVTADVSGILEALPERVAAEPTVQCHRVPCIAVTSESWRHLMDVYAKSEEGVRRIALQVGLSAEGDTMTLGSVCVKSTEDYFQPKVFRARKGEIALSLDLCGVHISFDASRAYIIDVGDRRLGAVFDGEGELRLEPTSDGARDMLHHFISAPDMPMKLRRIFLSCPLDEAAKEVGQVKDLAHQIDGLEKGSRRKLGKRAAESLEGFLKDCMKSTYPLNEEEAFQGLAPYAGYEYPALVVQTRESALFGFSFDGEQDAGAVVMTSPETGSLVSFWESPDASHEWTIPDPEHYAFDVTWLPDQLRVAIKCTVSVSGLKPGQDIRFLLNPFCEVKSCRIDGRETSITQYELDLDGSVSSAISCNYLPSSADACIQLSAPRTAIVDGRAEVSIEYTIDYRDTEAIETLREGYWASFCKEGFTLNGFCRWFPFTRWRSEPDSPCTMDFRVAVPAGFTAVAQGFPEAPEAENGTTVWRYSTDFSTTTPSLVVGEFEEFVEDEFEPNLVVFTRSGEAVGRRWLDALSLVVAWAERYCGKFPYKRFAVVEATPGDIGGISWPTMLTMTDMVDATYLWWMLSHEVSHQWWGDAARMLKMDDIWLHEGTAVYFNKLFSEDLNIRKPILTGSTKDMTAWARKFEAKAPISAGFMMGPPGGGIRLFHVKGALIYHILRMATNSDRHFFATLRQYHVEAQKAGLTEAGLREALEKAIGHDLSGLFKLYVHSRHLPNVQVEVTDVSAKDGRATLSISARVTPPGYELPYPIDFYPRSGQPPRRQIVFIGPDSSNHEFEAPFADVSRVVGNPEALLLVAEAEQEDVELYTG